MMDNWEKANYQQFEGAILKRRKSVDLQKYKYSKDHEWICQEQEEIASLGITDYAQTHLGDIVYIDLPSAGTQLKQFEKMGEIESVKAVSEILSPVSGQVIEINQKSVDEPSLVNQSPYVEGWLIKIRLKNLKELDNLMDINQYEGFIAKLIEE
jgi:glycine cleavage system H protein